MSSTGDGCDGFALIDPSRVGGSPVDPSHPSPGPIDSTFVDGWVAGFQAACRAIRYRQPDTAPVVEEALDMAARQEKALRTIVSKEKK